MTSRIAKAASVENIRLPARLRLRFEEELEGGDGQIPFAQAFQSELEVYAPRFTSAFTETFNVSEATKWFASEQIDIVTWHYRTRHSIFIASTVGEWFSGQVIFDKMLRDSIAPENRERLSPYREIKSPYIGVFNNEKRREQVGLGGPICIMLPATRNGDDDQARLKVWGQFALNIPPNVTDLLITFPEHPGTQDPLGEKHLNSLAQIDAAFLKKLTERFEQLRGEPLSPVKALNYLLASLKVTLNLLRLRSDSPRSTFLSPAYVAGEEVGGMAFACNGIVSREAALLGDLISNVLLSHLRLREDALAHQVVEEQQKLDQAKRFIIGRLAHDFRHPLEALQATVVDVSRSFSVISQQISQINRMMDDTILAIEGRDPAGLLRPKKSLDSVNEFLSDLRSYFRKQFETQGKQLILSGVDPRWTLQIDKGMVHEVLENLIRNALEHGGPRTRVLVERQARKYLFHIQDDGPGIPDKQRAEIFRPFLNSKERTAEGRTRGRGLAIAKMLVEAHGGSLRLDPCDEEWRTNFVLELPEE